MYVYELNCRDLVVVLVLSLCYNFCRNHASTIFLTFSLLIGKLQGKMHTMSVASRVSICIVKSEELSGKKKKHFHSNVGKKASFNFKSKKLILEQKLFFKNLKKIALKKP